MFNYPRLSSLPWHKWPSSESKRGVCLSAWKMHAILKCCIWQTRRHSPYSPWFKIQALLGQQLFQTGSTFIAAIALGGSVVHFYLTPPTGAAAYKETKFLHLEPGHRRQSWIRQSLRLLIWPWPTPEARQLYSNPHSTFFSFAKLEQPKCQVLRVAPSRLLLETTCSCCQLWQPVFVTGTMCVLSARQVTLTKTELWTQTSSNRKIAKHRLHQLLHGKWCTNNWERPSRDSIRIRHLADSTH